MIDTQPIKENLGICILCGQFKKLTFEHFPPDAVQGDSYHSVYRGMPFGNDFTKQVIFTEHKIPAKGYGTNCLCKECNNSTKDLDQALVKLTREIDNKLKGNTIFPAVIKTQVRSYKGRIYRSACKQLLTVFKEPMKERYSWLSSFILDETDTVALGTNFNLYLYAVNPLSQIIETGICPVATREEVISLFCKDDIPHEFSTTGIPASPEIVSKLRIKAEKIACRFAPLKSTSPNPEDRADKTPLVGIVMTSRPVEEYRDGKGLVLLPINSWAGVEINTKEEFEIELPIMKSYDSNPLNFVALQISK